MKPRVTSRSFLPEKLDVAAFIDAQAELNGACSMAEMPRLAQCLAPETRASNPSVDWSIKGWLEPQRTGVPHRWLSVHAQASLFWTCQRCLAPVALPVVVDRRIRWVADEQQAEALDAELEDDVLALVRQADILALIEDELIMDAPLVPRHDTCPEPLTMSTDDPQHAAPAEEDEGKPNPFAVLAGLKLPSKK